jgi:hypothetical protein
MLMSAAASTLLASCMIVLATAATGTARSDCLKETSRSETVTGQLAVVAAADADGRPERPYILSLAEPVCLTASEPDLNVPDTRQIHIYSSMPDVRAAIARLVSRRVRVTGQPFSAHTAHHHAPIVMDVDRIELAP